MQVLTFEIFQLLKTYASSNSKVIQTQYEDRHAEKLNRLICKTQVTKNILSNNWVKNFSSRDFTQSQINVLKKGTKFAIAPTKIPTLDFVCGVELDAS